MMKMKKWFVFFVLVAFLIVSTHFAKAATYYVKQGGTGDGSTYEQAWSLDDFRNSANWGAGTGMIGPGDTVYFSGTFDVTGAITIYGSGTPGNSIIFDGDDGVRPKAVFNIVGFPDDVFIINNRHYLDFRDIEFTGQGRNVYDIFGDSSYIDIHDIKISAELHSYAINIHGASFMDLYRNDLRNIVYMIDGTQHSSNEAIWIMPGHDIEVYSNRLTDWGHSAINVENNGLTDTYNIEIYDNYFDAPTIGYGRALGAGANADGGEVYNVSIHHNFINMARAPTQIGSIRDVYIYGNVFKEIKNCCEDNTNDGIDAGCTMNYYNCVGLESACTGNNQPWGCCSGPSQGDCWRPDKSKLYTQTGMHLGISSAYRTAENIHIFNNVFGPSPERNLGMSSKDYGINGLYIKNNIFYDGGYACNPSDDPIGSSNQYEDRAISSTYGNFNNVEFENNFVYAPTLPSKQWSKPNKEIYWYTAGGYDDLQNYYTNIEEFDQDFNSMARAPDGIAVSQNNKAQDPGFASSTQLWPDSLSDPIVGAGLDLGAPYDRLIDPVNSDFSVFPPDVVLVGQPANWTIGAYALEGSGPATFCGDSNCDADEDCLSCPGDCPTPGGQVCCSGSLYTGDCCTNSDCTSPQVCLNNQCSAVDICDGLVLLHHYDMNPVYGENGSLVHDFSGEGNNGTVFGNASHNTSGKFSGAYDYDGVDDRIDVQDSNQLDFITNNQDFSFSFWFYPSASDPYKRMLARGESDVPENNWQVTWGDDSGERVTFIVTVDGTDHDLRSDFLTVGVWHHVVGVWNGSVILFVDGAEQTSDSSGWSAIAQDSFSVGCRKHQSGSYMNYFPGLIDEVAVWNRSLTGQEIQELFSSGQPVSCQAAYHPADSSPRDCRIDSQEITDYIQAFYRDSTANPIHSVMDGIAKYYQGSYC